jgi:hypothetical protein
LIVEGNSVVSEKIDAKDQVLFCRPDYFAIQQSSFISRHSTDPRRIGRAFQGRTAEGRGFSTH